MSVFCLTVLLSLSPSLRPFLAHTHSNMTVDKKWTLVALSNAIGRGEKCPEWQVQNVKTVLFTNVFIHVFIHFFFEILKLVLFLCSCVFCFLFKFFFYTLFMLVFWG